MKIEFQQGLFYLQDSGSYGSPELHMNGKGYGACDIPEWPSNHKFGQIAQQGNWSAGYAVRVCGPDKPFTPEERMLASRFVNLARIGQGAPTIDHLQ
jgi:hypothetical protein